MKNLISSFVLFSFIITLSISANAEIHQLSNWNDGWISSVTVANFSGPQRRELCSNKRADIERRFSLGEVQQLKFDLIAAVCVETSSTTAPESVSLQITYERPIADELKSYTLLGFSSKRQCQITMNLIEHHLNRAGMPLLLDQCHPHSARIIVVDTVNRSFRRVVYPSKFSNANPCLVTLNNITSKLSNSGLNPVHKACVKVGDRLFQPQIWTVSEVGRGLTNIQGKIFQDRRDCLDSNITVSEQFISKGLPTIYSTCLPTGSTFIQQLSVVTLVTHPIRKRTDGSFPTLDLCNKVRERVVERISEYNDVIYSFCSLATPYGQSQYRYTYWYRRAQ